jgi:hypothetical protein
MGGIAAIGSSIGRGNADGPPETFTTVAGVVSIGSVDLTRDTVDTTTLDAPGGFEQLVPTLLRTGEVELGLNFDPVEDTQLQFITDMLAKTSNNYRILFSDTAGTGWTFAAFVVGFSAGGDINPESKLEATVTLKIDGAPTFS